MNLFVCYIIFTFISFTLNAEAARPLIDSNQSEQPSLLSFISMKCVRLSRKGPSEILVNSCGGCRIVAVSRKRSGIAMPILRNFNVHPYAPYTLPFKGPGRSRITTIQNCQSKDADTKDVVKRNMGNELGKCVVLKQMVNGSAVIINGCNTCRGVSVQRINKNGRAMNRQTFKLKPNQSTLVKPKGAVQLRLIAEIACPF
jgi:hypothetical protein